MVMKLLVALSPGVEEQLAQAATRLNVSPDELATAAVRDLLARLDEDFDRAATRVLDKNRQLYHRLA